RADFVKGGELERLAFEAEIERADAAKLRPSSGRCRHRDNGGVVRRIQGSRDLVLRVDRKVGQREKLRTAAGGDGRILRRAELVVLDRPTRGNVLDVAFRIVGGRTAAGGCPGGRAGLAGRVGGLGGAGRVEGALSCFYQIVTFTPPQPFYLVARWSAW